MKKLKIIISNYDDIYNPYYSGGGAWALHEIGKRLAKRHDVTVVCGAYPGAKNETLNGVHYLHIGIPFGGPIIGQLAYTIALPFAVRRLSFDVWFESFTPPHSTNMLALFTAKPVIGVTSLLDAGNFSKKYHIPFTWIERIGLRMYKFFVALSPSLEKKIRLYNATGEIRVIPYGISQDYLRLQTTEHRYVYFLGRLDIFQKGLDILLDAWKQIASKIPGIKLHIAGEGTPHDHKKLETLVAHHGLEKSVILRGRVSGGEKADLIKNALAAVFPSRFESFGMAALEALAVGKPMICFDIEGFSWIDQDVCVKVKPYDASSFANALRVVLEEKKLRITLGKKARKFAEPYIWEKIAIQYEQFAIDVYNKSI
jgi:glycosyltransferase involved in cell wall biosynthesis